MRGNARKLRDIQCEICIDLPEGEIFYIGLFSSISLVFCTPFYDQVDDIIQAGFEGVDIWCGRPHLYRRDHPPAVLERLSEQLTAHDLSPVSLMPAFFRYPYSLSSPVEAIRQDSIQYVIETIENAAAVGCKQVLIVPSHSLQGQTTEEARRRYLGSLTSICQVAEDKDVMLGLEILHPGVSDYMCSSQDALAAIEDLRSPNLGVVIDTGHLNLSGEDTESAILNLGYRLLQVHVNDNDGRQQQNAIPGDGTYDFPRLIQLLHAVGYEGFLSLELGWTYTFDPVPAVSEALKRMQAYLSM